MQHSESHKFVTCQVGNDIISYVSIYISLEEGNLVLRISGSLSGFLFSNNREGSVRDSGNDAEKR